jgi:hypothetical protein
MNAAGRNNVMRALCLLACTVLCAPVLLAQYSVNNLAPLGDYQSARSSAVCAKRRAPAPTEIRNAVKVSPRLIAFGNF